MKSANLKEGMPQVREALAQLDRELRAARQEGLHFLKLIHGYGSTGACGEIRIGVQKKLCEMKDRGEISDCIFGENWSRSDESAWKLLQTHPHLKQDADLGRKNLGITVVVL